MGESTSEVELRWSVTRDLWTGVQPDLSVLMQPIREANRRFADYPGRVQALIVAALPDRYRRQARPHSAPHFRDRPTMKPAMMRITSLAEAADSYGTCAVTDRFGPNSRRHIHLAV
jgi:hypothetical protein